MMGVSDSGFNVFTWQRAVTSSDLPTGAKCVALCLGTYAAADGRCWPSVEALGEDASLRRQAVSKHLTRLERAGLITRQRRPNATTLYKLTLPCLDVSISGRPQNQPYENPPSTPSVVSKTHHPDGGKSGRPEKRTSANRTLDGGKSIHPDGGKSLYKQPIRTNQEQPTTAAAAAGGVGGGLAVGQGRGSEHPANGKEEAAERWSKALHDAGLAQVEAPPGILRSIAEGDPALVSEALESLHPGVERPISWVHGILSGRVKRPARSSRRSSKPTACRIETVSEDNDPDDVLGWMRRQALGLEPEPSAVLYWREVERKRQIERERVAAEAGR